MPKCLLCNKRRWFFQPKCDCKSKVLRERARPVVRKELSAPKNVNTSRRDVDSAYARSTPSNPTNQDMMYQQNIMLAQSLDSDLAKTEHTSPRHHHAATADCSPSYDSPSDTNSYSSCD